MDITTTATIAGSAVAVIGAAAVTARVAARSLAKVSKKLDQLSEDWYGQPARPGFRAIPGIPERLEMIENQLKPNGGSSTRDAINRVELGLNRLSIDQTILQRQLNEHLSITRYGMERPPGELPPGYVEGERS
jgi:hypothetical protein